MKKLLFLFLFLLGFFVFKGNIFAYTACSDRSIEMLEGPPSSFVSEEFDSITVKASGLKNQEYKIIVKASGIPIETKTVTPNNGIAVVTFSKTSVVKNTKIYGKPRDILLKTSGSSQCLLYSYEINPKSSLPDGCDLKLNYSCNPNTGETSVSFTISNAMLNGDPFSGVLGVKIGGFVGGVRDWEENVSIAGGSKASVNIGKIAPGTHKVEVLDRNTGTRLWKSDIIIPENCNLTDPELIGGGSQIGDQTTIEVAECSFNGSEGIETALGCIPTEPKGLISWILKYAVSIGGGIAFLLMVFGGFILSTSSGNPEKVKQGQEILTSAIVGLLFIIFSVFLLQFIGVDILKIPGFTN